MLRLNYLILSLITFLSFSQHSNAQFGADRIYQPHTYNNSFWQTQSTSGSPAYENKPIRRRNSLLGFRIKGGAVYSTGVNDAMLTANNINFTPGNFRSLPVEDVHFRGSNTSTPAPSDSFTFFAFPADADIAKQAGSKLKWHVPTKAKADELRKMFAKEGIDIDVVIVPNEKDKK